MTDRIRAFLTFVSEVMTEPGANLTAAVLLLAAVTTVLLLIVVAATFYLLPSANSARSGELSGEKHRKTKTPRRTSAGGRFSHHPGIGWVTGGLVVLALISAYLTSAQDFYCITCHQEIRTEPEEFSVSYSSLIETTSAETPLVAPPAQDEVGSFHEGARCVSCHERAQFRGLIANTMTRLRHVAGWIVSAEPSALPLDSDRCLTCHGAILDRTTASADGRLRMSHDEPIEAGMSCDACHRGVGHSPDPRPDPGMSTCLRCHDGEQASSACETCHADDIAFAGTERLTFAPVNLPPVTDCGGCHEQDSCDACHGMRMPHSTIFIEGEHARDAGFDKKRICWRCHSEGECGKCHQTKPMSRGYWGHFDGTLWKQEHGSIGFGGNAGCGCHGRSPYAREGNYCAACH